MKIAHGFIAILACAILTGCPGIQSQPGDPDPTPVSKGDQVPASDVMRVGDKIIIRLTGVEDGEYNIEKEIPASGQVTVPLLTQNFQAAGRTCDALAADITDAYITGKIYTNPNVTIIEEERYVNVDGDVRGPQRVLYTSDLTLLSAITSCGGFDEYANRHKVTIRRGKDLITVDATTAERNPAADPPLYPGDQIHVPRSMF